MKIVKKTPKRVSKKPKSKKIIKLKTSKSPSQKKNSHKKIWEPKFEAMKKRLDIALKKLEKDVKNKAPFEIIENDNNELLLLLGECNYIVREFHRKS